MPENSAQPKVPGLNNLRFDRRLLTSAEVLAGAGALLWVAGWIVGAAAVRRAAQDWLEQLEQPPSEVAMSKWRQLLQATAAGTAAYKDGIPAGR